VFFWGFWQCHSHKKTKVRASLRTQMKNDRRKNTFFHRSASTIFFFRRSFPPMEKRRAIVISFYCLIHFLFYSFFFFVFLSQGTPNHLNILKYGPVHFILSHSPTILQFSVPLIIGSAISSILLIHIASRNHWSRPRPAPGARVAT
jgi:hypothetical protein